MMTFFRKHPYWLVCIIAILCVSLYWSLWATDRYVSKATVVVQSAKGTSIGSFSISSLLSGGGSHQLLVLRQFLRSIDMLKKLNKALGLRKHFSSDDIDFFSRLDSPDVPLEVFHQYYLDRVTIKLDEYANVLNIKVQAFDPRTAHAIAAMLLHAGEVHMNQMSQHVAEQQIKFIRQKVNELKQDLHQAREALLSYQRDHDLISPTGAVETLSTVVGTLLGKVAELKAQRHALAQTYSRNSAQIQQLDREIDALHNQIEELRGRMTASSGTSLNRQSAEYTTLKTKLEFARKMYTNALAALQGTRVQAASTLKKVLTLQSPTTPEYSTAPNRLHIIVVFSILAVLAALIVHLLVAIVRDHKD